VLLDADSLPDGSVVETDLCVVGAGPAGIALARELVGESFRVCLIESGGTRFEPMTQELSRLGDTDSDISPAHAYRRRQFGGNAHFWTVGRKPFRSLVRYLPLDEIDFAVRPWVPYSGWPFPRTTLDPYYARAHAVVGLGEYSTALPDDPGARPLPLDSRRVRTSVEWFGTARPFVEEYLKELRQAANVTVLLHANAGTLEERAGGGHVDRLGFECLNGNVHSVRASVFVLGAGGIENARLLLLSNKRQPAGIGNVHDLVGRFFMDHLHVRGVLAPADRRLFETTALYDVRPLPDGRVMGCKLNLTDRVMADERILNSALKLDARLPTRPLTEYLRTYARLALLHRQLRPSFFGWSTLPGVAHRFPDFATHLQIELPPDPANRVFLGDERDRFSRPLASVRWKWNELSRHTVQRARTLLAAELARAGVGTLTLTLPEESPSLPNRLGINHHLGTTRMHTDPKHGVVDANGRVHDVSNLYVTGGSVFPTGGYANPTLTIVALSIRLADHLRGLVRSRVEVR
jgi:choline dehydrogenase-like flavoprotein